MSLFFVCVCVCPNYTYFISFHVCRFSHNMEASLDLIIGLIHI